MVTRELQNMVAFVCFCMGRLPLSFVVAAVVYIRYAAANDMLELVC